MAISTGKRMSLAAPRTIRSRRACAAVGCTHQFLRCLARLAELAATEHEATPAPTSSAVIINSSRTRVPV